MLGADNSVKNLPMSNPKADLHNINAHTNLVKIHCDLLKLLSLKSKKWIYCGQITLSKIDKIFPSAIPNQVSTVSIHTPSLVKIHWHLLKVSSRNENTDISRADNSVKNWRNLPINCPKPDLHNINAHTEFGENSLTFTEVIVWKWKYGWTHGQPTWYHNTQALSCGVI